MQLFQYLQVTDKEIFLIENPLPQSQMGECTLLDFYILVQVLEQFKLSCSYKPFEFLSFPYFLMWGCEAGYFNSQS